MGTHISSTITPKTQQDVTYTFTPHPPLPPLLLLPDGLLLLPFLIHHPLPPPHILPPTPFPPNSSLPEIFPLRRLPGSSNLPLHESGLRRLLQPVQGHRCLHSVQGWLFP